MIQPIANVTEDAESNWRGLGALVAFTVLGIMGCDRSGLNLAPVEGVVTLDGKPVEAAGVVFMPVDPKQGPPASGTTDAAGKFTLTTANRPGASVGEHRVAISKADSFGEEIPPEQFENPEAMRQRGFKAYKTKHYIPEKYSTVDSSGLTATVADEDNSLDFKLTTPK